MTKTAQIALLLEKRFPCQAVPTGAMSDIAAEVGCSRELVRQVANSMGLGTPGSRGHNKKPRRGCVTCGEPLALGTKRDYHSNGKCLPYLETTCAWCGAAVTKRISELVSLARNAQRTGVNATGRVFCNKTCQGKWLGSNYGGGRG